MDVKAYLISQGTDEETATAIAANPKFASVYEKAAAKAEEGTTALLKAQEVEKSLKTWNETKVVPYVRDADNKVAAANAKLAAQAAHWQTLKDQGYEVPDAFLEAGGGNNPAPKVEPVNNGGGKDYDDLIQKGQLAQMELIDLANEAYDLTGKRVSVNAEYKEFGQSARPGENLRSYITRKYDLDTIRSTKSKEAEQKRLDEYAATKVTAAQAEWAKSHGSNGETRIPVNSRFDKVAEERKVGGGDKLWQTQEGRETARKSRLEKYSGLLN